MSRIIYPSGFDQQYTLVQNILNKNNCDGAASVLNSFLIQQGIDPATQKSQVERMRRGFKK